MASVFDALGLFAPFTLRLRILLTTIWAKSRQQWDEKIKEGEEKKCLDWVEKLVELKNMPLLRRYFEMKLQEKRFACFLICLSETNVYSGLSASGKWWWIGIVICLWESQNCPNEAADDPIFEFAGCNLLCEAEAFDHLRPRHPDPDSDILDRLYDGPTMTAPCAYKEQLFVANRARETVDQSTVD